LSEALSPESAPIPLIRVRELSKTYPRGNHPVHALRDVDLDVDAGELIAIMGQSGSGKTTFLNLLGCLDRPTAGRYWLAGALVSALPAAALARLRNRKLGFVFQSFNLLPRATALENVLVPLIYAGMTGAVAQQRGLQALELVGLSDRASHRPNELSGGQQQRIAIARSLVTSPSIILADEPTGNLDTKTSAEIMNLLQALNTAGMTIVVVTHEPDIAAYCQRMVTFQDGRIVDDRPVSHSGRREVLA
jgi:putative ABC transport system ATP-binding protein